jgi:diguanylate cyclase (GGDEF)-like protein
MLDLDDFKKVNDTFGHKIGDRMLREVANLIQSQLRDYDFLARYAGDEFVALLPDLTVQQVDELRARIESVVRGFSLSVRAQTRASVGISIGASVFGTDGDTLDQLLIAADQAMYQAKNAHKTAALTSLPPEPLIETSTTRPSEILPKGFITSAIN